MYIVPDTFTTSKGGQGTRQITSQDLIHEKDIFPYIIISTLNVALECTVDAFHRHAFNISFAYALHKKQCRHTHIGIHTKTNTYTCRQTDRQMDTLTNAQRHTQRQTCTDTDRKVQTDKADTPTHAGTHTNTCKETTMDQFTETLRHRDTYGHSERHTQTQERHIVTERETHTRKHTDTCRPQREAYKMHKDIHVHRNTGR